MAETKKSAGSFMVCVRTAGSMQADGIFSVVPESLRKEPLEQILGSVLNGDVPEADAGMKHNILTQMQKTGRYLVGVNDTLSLRQDSPIPGDCYRSEIVNDEPVDFVDLVISTTQKGGLSMRQYH